MSETTNTTQTQTEHTTDDDYDFTNDMRELIALRHEELCTRKKEREKQKLDEDVALVITIIVCAILIYSIVKRPPKVGNLLKYFLFL